jgi:hypothetical protein
MPLPHPVYKLMEFGLFHYSYIGLTIIQRSLVR